MSAMELTPYQKIMAEHAAQPDLLDLTALEQSMSIDECKHSARWLAVREPRKYLGIVRGLYHHVPIVVMAEFFEVSRNTIRAVQEIEAESLDHDKKGHTLATLKKLREAAATRLLEMVDNNELDGKTLAIVLGISSDKIKDIEGASPMEVPTLHLKISVADIAARVREAQERVMRDVTPAEPVSEGESERQMGGELGECVEQTVVLVVGNHTNETQRE
jgi:hypothetical protein